MFIALSRTLILLAVQCGDSTWTDPLEVGPAPPAEPELVSVGESGCSIVVAERENPPRLVLSPGGPGGIVRALAFRADGTRFYSAGFDKAIQGWDLAAASRSIQREARTRALLVQTLRWEISRGLRGTINVLAASPEGAFLAVGGFSARDSTGDIVVFDARAARVERALLGHRDAVVSLDFSPNGKAIVSVSRDGEIRVWSANNNWDSKVLRPPGGLPTSFQPARFLDDQTIIAAYPVDAAGAQWRIGLLSLAGGEPRMLPTVHAKRLRSIAVHRGAAGELQWATADAAGQIFAWAGRGDAEPRLVRKGREAVCLDFAPDGKLFASTNLTPSGKMAQAWLEYWDPTTGKLIDEVEVSREKPSFACKASPDGATVSVVAENAARVRSYRVRNAVGQVIERPLSGPAPVTLSGRGRGVRHVAFDDARPGYRVGFGYARGEVARAFDFGECRPVPDAERAGAKWRAASDRFGDWKILVDPKEQASEDVPTVWHFVRGEQKRGTVTALPKVHGKYTCWCWLPGANGEPYAIAFGSRITDGVFIYRVSDEGEWPLLRYYRDHAGDVASLAVSSDGKYLASAGEDQTVKIWSLEGLRNPVRGFASAIAWGAELEIRDGRVEVIEASPAGIAIGRGLIPGDRLAAATLPQEGKPVTITDPTAMLQAFASVAPNDPVVLRVERRGGPLGREILMVPAWLPLLTLFQEERGEWALWTPQGYFDASVDGDTLFGWQINRGPGRAPDVFRAEHLRKEFERPGALRRILTAGNVREALRLASAAGDPRKEVALSARLGAAPTVSIVEPQDGEEVRDGKVKVVARIEYPDPDAAARIQGRAYVNGAFGSPQRDLLADGVRTVEWSVPVVELFNRVRVQAEEDNPERPVNSADVFIRGRGIAGGRKPRLHLFTVAVAAYKFADQLPSTLADAKAVAESLGARTQSLYEPGRTIALRNENVSRESIRAAVEEWRRLLANAKADDLLIVFLAGHGVADPASGEYYFIPPTSSAENYVQTGAPWSEFRSIARLPCRKLFLIDTCHSGGVIPLQREAPESWKRPVRSLRDSDVMVLAAADVGQEALEFASVGHGVFTECILEGLAGAAPVRGDGRLYLNDLARYVEGEVPRRAAEVHRIQTPRSSPTDLFELLAIPLADKKSIGGEPRVGSGPANAGS
jgi:WD40 repeat protein